MSGSRLGSQRPKRAADAERRRGAAELASFRKNLGLSCVPGMEVRHLRYFVAVAEELHFGRAAERLHVAQPGLSQQIKSMETELGVCLFERTKRHVSLTEAGSVFLAEAYACLNQLDHAVETMRQFRTAVRKTTVRVGIFPPWRLGPELVRAVRRRVPGVVLMLEPLPTAALVHAVERGELGLGIVRSVPEHSPVSRRLVASEPLGVCLPSRHRLAARASIKAAALKKEPMIWFGRTANPHLFDTALQALEVAGLRVQTVESAGGMTSTLALVAGGPGWALITESELIEGGPKELVWRPFADVQLRAETWAIWTETVRRPHMLQIVDTLADVCSGNSQLGNK